jgi:hypothetical protein
MTGREKQTPRRVVGVAPNKGTLPPIVAVHEAGHAVARVLAAGELGYGLDEVISCIDMGAQAERWENGQRVTCDQGSTWGPHLSKEMETASAEFQKAYHKNRGSPGYETEAFWPTIMKLSRAAGADVEKWFRAQVFQHVSGPIAEAIASNRSFADIWNGHGWDADDDRKDVAGDAGIAGVSVRKLASTVNRMAVVSAYLMDNPEVWAGVLALAEKLPDFGTVDGGKAVRIIASAVPESELLTLFAKAMQQVSELERAMRAAKVVSMQTADGSKITIKSGNLTHQLRAKGKKNVHDEPLQYECVFPVLAETLCRAFWGRRVVQGRKGCMSS